MFAYLSVCPSAWNTSASIGQVFMKLDIWGFLKICPQNLNLIKIWQKLRALCMKIFHIYDKEDYILLR
jgi:hypothetical protein